LRSQTYLFGYLFEDMSPDISSLHDAVSRRIGLVGFCCDTGLGVVNRSLYQHLPFTSWLVLDHPQYGILRESLDDRCYELGLKSQRSIVIEWLSTLEGIFAVERGFVPGLRGLSLSRSIEFILMPNAEWLDLGDPGVQLIDRFIAPTEHCYRILCDAGFQSRTTFIPHFVDTSTFKCRIRDRANRFVHFRGHGGFQERKGTGSVLEVARRCPEIEFLICSQEPLPMAIPSNVTVHSSTLQPEHQYAYGDIAIQPSRWEGVGLQILEAMASGIPTIVPNAPPMNEYPADDCLLIRFRAGVVDLGHKVWPTAEIDIDHLESVVRALHKQDIAEMSARARVRMEQRSWNLIGSQYAHLLGLNSWRRS
jgi:glycosyltransferase involved in cell wall biosynthesis